MIRIASLFFVSAILVACSSTKTLEMNESIDLSMLPEPAQCWLVDFEEVCISLAENKGFSDKEQLQEDIGRAAALVAELAIGNEGNDWYDTLPESEKDRLKELTIDMVAHYGVKHFIELED